jgi:hypothetical protein
VLANKVAERIACGDFDRLIDAEITRQTRDAVKTEVLKTVAARVEEFIDEVL